MPTLNYDTRGSLITSGTSGYIYSSENLLLIGPSSVTLNYDPAMRLYQSVGGGVTTRFLYDGPDMIAEYNASNALQRRYVHGPGSDEPILWYVPLQFNHWRSGSVQIILCIVTCYLSATRSLR